MVKSNRTFTIKSSCINVSGGRYKSSSPASAAKKAANRLYKTAKASQKYKTIKRLTFVIKETTSGSTKAEFNYKATRTLLKKPIVRVINGKEIVNKFKIKVEAMKTSKDVAKKSKVKCNKIPKDGWFGGEPGENEVGDEVDGLSQDPAASATAEIPEDKLEDKPEDEGMGGGAKKRRYRKKKSPK